MNCSKNVTLRNGTGSSVISPRFAFSSAGIILLDEPGARRRGFFRRFERAWSRAPGNKPPCITMGVCIFGRYKARNSCAGGGF
jgi:hypothetical protein